MNIRVRVFPIAGLTNMREDMELFLAEGNLDELFTDLEKRFGAKVQGLKSLMFLHNGRALSLGESICFNDGDELWLLPLLSGG